MSRLTIKVHESRISRMRNKDAYYKWMNDSMSLTGLKGASDAGGCIEDSDGNPNPYFALYIDDPDKPSYDEKTLDSKIKQAMDYIRKEIPNLRGIEDVIDYFDFELEDGGLCDIDIIVVPKDALWDEDIEDIKYLSNKAVHIIDNACADGSISEDALFEKGFKAP